MEKLPKEEPSPLSCLKVGIIYNLKKGIKSDAPDVEAEYDNISTVNAIKAVLQPQVKSVALFEADEFLPEKLRTSDIDIAFNIAEGKGGRGREAQIPAILNLYGIPFTGSDETTLCIALDKALTKRLMQTYGITTPQYRILTKENIAEIDNLHFPVIIKPNAEGSSKGISDLSIVSSREELAELAAKNLELYSQNMLAEEYIHGREFTVGVLGNGEDTKVFPPMEIIYKRTTQADFCVYSYNVKQDYKKFIDYCCPACLTAAQNAEMINMTKTIYDALECKDFARVDFRMTADGRIYFIEINPLPGLAPSYSDYPMLAEFCGVDYNSIVTAVLTAAVTRLKLGRRTKNDKV